MLSWLLAIQSSFPIQWLIWPVASTLHHLRFLNRMPFNPKWTCILNWKCLAMFLDSNRTELWIRVKIVHSSFFFSLWHFLMKISFCIKEMFGHRHPRRRILTCSRNSTKPFLVLITRAKVWNESNYLHHSICFYVYCCFKMISLLCTGRSDRVTRSIKSLVFKSRQSWKILVKLRVLLFQKIFVIRQFHYRWRRVSVSSGNWVHPGEFASSGIIIFFLFLHCSLSSVTGLFISHGDSRWKKKNEISSFCFWVFPIISKLLLLFPYFDWLHTTRQKKHSLFFSSLSLWLFAVLLSLWETHHIAHTCI